LKGGIEFEIKMTKQNRVSAPQLLDSQKMILAVAREQHIGWHCSAGGTYRAVQRLHADSYALVSGDAAYLSVDRFFDGALQPGTVMRVPPADAISDTRSLLNPEAMRGRRRSHRLNETSRRSSM
jgi:hypothetical protein